MAGPQLSTSGLNGCLMPDRIVRCDSAKLEFTRAHFAAQIGMSALTPKADIWPIRNYCLCGAFDADVDLAAQCSEIDGFGQKRFGATLQSLTLCFFVAVGRNHDDGDVGPSGFGFGQ